MTSNSFGAWMVNNSGLKQQLRDGTVTWKLEALGETFSQCNGTPVHESCFVVFSDIFLVVTATRHKYFSLAVTCPKLLYRENVCNFP